jgi:hypothetical protein
MRKTNVSNGGELRIGVFPGTLLFIAADPYPRVETGLHPLLQGREADQMNPGMQEHNKNLVFGLRDGPIPAGATHFPKN